MTLKNLKKRCSNPPYLSNPLNSKIRRALSALINLSFNNPGPSAEPYFRAGNYVEHPSGYGAFIPAPLVDVFCRKARKFLTRAEKFCAKFDTFALKRVMSGPRRNVNASLQVKTGSRHNLLAFDHDVHQCHHVMLFGWLASFRRKLPIIRRILLNLDDNHVKLSPKLLCSDAITSNFAGHFHAAGWSRQSAAETSLLKRDQVLISTERDGATALVLGIGRTFKVTNCDLEQQILCHHPRRGGVKLSNRFIGEPGQD